MSIRRSLSPKEVNEMVHRIQQLQQHFPLNHIQQTRKQNDTKFKDILAEYDGLKISKHAKQRLEERNIKINSDQWEVISEKMNEAKQKGVTDSVVILNNAALLVSAKNHTVVTAMDRNEASAKVFTNINGTILINE